jgi:hypothetical protein
MNWQRTFLGPTRGSVLSAHIIGMGFLLGLLNLPSNIIALRREEKLEEKILPQKERGVGFSEKNKLFFRRPLPRLYR